MCHLTVCYIHPIYLSESERKSDGQCEQAVSDVTPLIPCILCHLHQAFSRRTCSVFVRICCKNLTRSEKKFCSNTIVFLLLSLLLFLGGGGEKARGIRGADIH